MEPAPKRLSKDAQKLWNRIVAGYEFDVIGLTILESAMDAFDRMRDAAATLKREGSVFKDRFGCPKQHPAFLNENAARLAMLRHLRALGVDMAQLPDSEDEQ